MSKFNSFVSIDLQDYNDLILKNKEQEELVIAQSEEIVKLQEDKEVFETLLKDTLLILSYLDMSLIQTLYF